MLAMCAGVTMQAIARRAHISSSGISQRVTAACGRYGVSTRIELLVVLLQRELLTLDDLRPENLQQVREQFEFTPTTRS